MTTVDYMIGMLPRHLRESVEMQRVLAVAADEVDYFDEQLIDVVSQLFVQTATWGLYYHEQELGMPTNPVGATMDERRLMLLTRKRSLKIGTGAAFLEMVRAIVPGAIVEEEWSTTTLRVRLPYVPSDYTHDQIQRLMELTAPAHWNIVVQYEGFIAGVSVAGDTL